MRKTTPYVGIFPLIKYKNKFEIDNIQDFINQEVKPLAGAMVMVKVRVMVKY